MVRPSLRLGLPNITNPVRSREFLTGDCPNLRDPSILLSSGQVQILSHLQPASDITEALPLRLETFRPSPSAGSSVRTALNPTLNGSGSRQDSKARQVCPCPLTAPSPTLKTDAWRRRLLSDTSHIWVWPAPAFCVLSLMPDTPDGAQLVNTSSYFMHLSSYSYSSKGLILLFQILSPLVVFHQNSPQSPPPPERKSAWLSCHFQIASS